jgi:secreted trypsin-like serine protease
MGMKIPILAVIVVALFTSCPEIFPVIPTDSPIVTGILFDDQNGNSLKDTGETGLFGWTIYNDANNNATLDAGELKTSTNSSGAYSLQVPEGALHVRHLMNLGFNDSKAVNVSAEPQVDPRIVGGQNAANGAYPFMVALLTATQPDPNQAQFCGGSLIAPHWVLTAAHCIVESANTNGIPTSFKLAENVDVMLGSNRLENPVTKIRAAQILVHPNYDANSQDYDMALIKLSSNSSLATVQPVLPSEVALAATGTSAKVIGWGNQSSTTNSYPIDLKEATVPIVAQNTCATNYMNNGGITARMICAGFAKGGIDSCQGDSGGPLLVSSGLPGVWRQAGVVSFGEGCALPNFPGVYTRVSEFNAYLEAQLGRGTSAVQEVTGVKTQTLTGVSFAVRQAP